MDYEMRGIIQKYIDEYITNRVLIDDLQLWNRYKGSDVIDLKSILLGQVFGGALRMLCNLNGVEEEELTQVDRVELRELFYLRINGITTVIEGFLNRSSL